jgi:hypothetical protein
MNCFLFLHPVSGDVSLSIPCWDILGNSLNPNDLSLSTEIGIFFYGTRSTVFDSSWLRIADANLFFIATDAYRAVEYVTNVSALESHHVTAITTKMLFSVTRLNHD